MKDIFKAAFSRSFIILILLLTICDFALANNLTISEVELADRDSSSGNITIEFDISWENSWYTKINHDAVWLTVRLYDPNSSPTHKVLCEIPSSGLNPTGTQVSSDFDIYVPADKKGAFLRPSDYGSNASVSLSDVQITVDYTSCGFATTDDVKASVLGIEMAYVPEGAFYAGDFDTSTAALDQGSADSDPWYISSSAGFNVSNPASDGYRYVSAGNADEDATGASFSISANYPKGYSPVYAMKYEITEGQWVEFINALPSASARARRDITNATHKNSDLVIARNTISCSGSPLICSTARPARPVSYLNWMDLTAFLDWAALRPMTELEYEKMTRGPIIPIAGEFAWGTTDITAAETISTGAETGQETITTTDANANFNNVTLTGGDAGNGAQYAQGPLRSGIFATASSDRVDSGSGYYGIMTLSGNLKERVVTIGNSVGRSFAGSDGDGVLSAESGCEGNANEGDWPGVAGGVACGVASADGSGFKGGAWDDQLSGVRLRISDRYEAAKSDASAYANAGGRGVRTHDE